MSKGVVELNSFNLAVNVCVPSSAILGKLFEIYFCAKEPFPYQLQHIGGNKGRLVFSVVIVGFRLSLKGKCTRFALKNRELLRA